MGLLLIHKDPLFIFYRILQGDFLFEICTDETIIHTHVGIVHILQIRMLFFPIEQFSNISQMHLVIF